VLDSNSASDSDIWIAWTLLEAGRLWKNEDYTATGKALLAKIADGEVVKVPGLGLMLLPGRVGFAEEARWRFNPSYFPPQVAQYFSRFGAPWTTLRDTNLKLLLDTAPKGFSPDWVSYDKKNRLAAEGSKPGRQLRCHSRLFMGGHVARRRTAKSPSA